MDNSEYLKNLGVKDAVHQQIIIEKLPCGITSVQEANEDKTSVEVNAPRALMILLWKGMLDGYILAEQRREEISKKQFGPLHVKITMSPKQADLTALLGLNYACMQHIKEVHSTVPDDLLDWYIGKYDSFDFIENIFDYLDSGKYVETVLEVARLLALENGIKEK